MANEELTALLDTHRKELAHQVALAVAGNDPARLEQITNSLASTIEALISYLRTGDFNTYKQFNSNYFAEILARNVPMQAIETANKAFYLEVKALIERVWTGKEQLKLRNSAIRRIEAVQRMQLVTVITTNIMKASKENEQ